MSRQKKLPSMNLLKDKLSVSNFPSFRQESQVVSGEKLALDMKPVLN